MPREIITGNAESPSALVGWDPIGSVQVGIEVAAIPYSDTPTDVTTPLTIATSLWGEHTHEAIGRYLAAHDHVGDIVGALVAAEDGTFKTSDAEADAMRLVGALVVEALDHYDPGMTPIRSLWWTPNRWQINKMIRLLRKARDGAFGRDE